MSTTRGRLINSIDPLGASKAGRRSSRAIAPSYPPVIYETATSHCNLAGRLSKKFGVERFHGSWSAVFAEGWRRVRVVLLVGLVGLLVMVAGGDARANDLILHVLDVGQGDALLVISPAGKTVLIDAGPPESSAKLTARLKQLVNKPLDLLIMTHAHADHIGGMEQALRALGARIFMEPGFNHPSPIYSKLLQALEEKKVTFKKASAGRNIDIGGGASMHVLAPPPDFFNGTRSDVNTNSVVLRITYGKTAFYLAADSESQTERYILENNDDLRSDVYKVAHHGSKHGSSAKLLARIKPQLAAVSVGANNEFGHPTRQALSRMAKTQARTLRTDLDGEMIFRSDGQAVVVTTKKSEVSLPHQGTD